MSKPDWGKLQQQFIVEHSRSGISPAAWCEAHGLNYATARRYIKKPSKDAQTELRKTAQKPEKKTAQKTAQNSTAQKERKAAVRLPKKRALKEEKPDSGKTELSFNPDDFGISEQQAIFVEHVAEGKTRVEAYRLAGYQGEGNTAYVNASRMLRNAKVAKAIRYLRDKRQQRYTADMDEIIHQLVAITKADPNLIVQHRRINCRYCWGENHFYQWRDIDEFDRAAAKNAADGKKEPEYGGLGFIENSDPNPDCPRCCGEGRPDVHVADSRDLEGNESHLYAGVKETKFGIEVQMASKENARRDLIRLLQAKDSGDKPGDRKASSYTPEDYRQADKWLSDNFEDLD